MIPGKTVFFRKPGTLPSRSPSGRSFSRHGMADDRWQMADGRWQMASSRRRLTDGKRRIAERNWLLAPRPTLLAVDKKSIGRRQGNPEGFPPAPVRSLSRYGSLDWN